MQNESCRAAERRRDAHRRAARVRRAATLVLLAGAALGLTDAAGAQQSTATWLNPVSGVWSNAALWSSAPFSPNNDNPVGVTYAVVAPLGSYTLTLDTDVTVDSVDMLGGTLRLDQNDLTLAPGGAVTLGSGARLHLVGGGLRDAVLNLGATTSGLRLEGTSNTLHAVTINGSSTITDSVAGATITGGLDLNGTLTFQNSSGGLTFSGDQTISGGTFFFDAAASPQVRNLTATDGSTVTLDAATVLRGRNFSLQGPANTGAIINQGRISAEVAGNTVTIAGRVQNAGIMEAVNGATLAFSGSGWSSSGLLRAGSGSVITLGGQGSLAGSTFETSAGAVNLTGSIANAGSTLTLSSSSGSWNLNGGSISGGTLRLLNGVNLSPNASSQNRLFGVTLDGTLSLTTTGARLRSVDGLSGGTVRLAGPDTGLVFDNSQTLSSNVVFGTTAGTATRLAVEQASALTLAPGVELRGGRATIGGHIFNQGAGSIINQGIISADVAGQTLTLNGTATAISNQGILRALNGGTLVFNGANGNTGSIQAHGAGSVFGLGGSYTINSPASITGGATLNLTGTWANAAGINLVDSTLSLGGSFTTAGLGVVNATNGTIRVPGGWNNTGATYTLPAGSAVTLAGGSITGGVIDGGGAIRVAPSTTGTLNGVTLNGNIELSGTTLNTNGLTLGGVASVGAGATMNLDGAWTNNGVINVDNSTLNLGGTVTNVGAINRSGTSNVVLTGVLDGSAQTITISPTSLITRVNGGTLRAGVLDLQDNPTLALSNTGSVRAGQITGTGVLSFTGNGSVTPPGNGPDGTLIIGENVTIRGALGSIGHQPLIDSNDTVINHGTITATGSGVGMNIWARNFTNAGLLEVTNNGTLSLYRNTTGELYTDWTNTGTIRVSSGALFMGGRFETSDIGTVEHLGGQVFINGQLDNSDATLSLTTPWIVTSSAGRVSGGTIDINPSTRLEVWDHGRLDGVVVNGNINSQNGEISGGITLNGVATIPTRLDLMGDQTINAGEFVLQGGTLNTLQGSLFVLASDVLVRGRGFMAAGANQAVVNEGRISADEAGQTLRLNQSSFLNVGTVEAVNGARLDVNGATVINEGIVRVAGGGRLNLGGTQLFLGSGSLVNDGGTLTITGAVENGGSTFLIGGAAGDINLTGRINGGIVNSTGGGRLVIPNDGSGTPTLNGVTLNADVDVFRLLSIVNGLTQSGTMNLNSGLIFLGSSNTLSGGTIQLTGSGQRDIFVESGGTLTIEPGTTIRGGIGVLADDGAGVPLTTVVNRGTISAATPGQTFSIAPDVFTNHGVIEALAGSTLNIGAQIPGVSGAARSWTSDGIIRVDGGTLLLGGTFPTSSLLGLQRAGGEVRLVGTLDNTEANLTLDGPDQSWILEGGGPFMGQFTGTRVRGGVVNLVNGAILDAPESRGGSFIGVTINGDLSVGGKVYLQDSTVNGTVTVRGGEIIVGPPGVAAPSTLPSGDFLFEVGGSRFGRITGNGDLTIGEDVTIRGGHADILAAVNRGSISADLPAAPLVARIGENTGLIEAVNGGTLMLKPTSLRGRLVNNGVIRVIDSALMFTGSTPTFQTIQRSGASVTFDGYVDNSDSVLVFDAETSWAFQTGSYIKGGEINILGKAPVPVGAGIAAGGPVTFDGLTIRGDLETTPTGERVDIYRGLTLEGTFRVDTPAAIVTFFGDQQFRAGTLFFDAAGGNGERLLRLRGLGPNGAGNATLTIAEDATIRGGDLRIATGTGTFTNATIFNTGLISADMPAERITIEARRFINAGIVEAINGGEIFYEGPPPLQPGDPLIFENDGRLNIGAGSAFSADLFQQGLTGVISMMIAGAESRDDLGRLVAREMNFEGALLVTLDSSFTPSYGDTFDLMDVERGHGSFRILALPRLPEGLAWHTDALYLNGSITVIPAPSAAALLAAGALLAHRRRRR